METIRIGDACKILNGYAFKSDKYVTSGIRVIRIANVQKGYIEDADPEFYPENYSGLDKYMLKEGDLLISLTGNVGRVAILQKEMLPAALNQRVACLRIKNPKISKGYLFHFLNSDYFENKCIQASKGVAQKNVSTEWLKEYEIPLYSAKKQAEIENTLDKLNLVIKHRKEELSDLDELIKARFVEMFGDPADISRKDKVELSEICEKITDGEHGSVARVPNGHPFLNAKQILKNGRIDWDTITYVGDEDHQRIYKRCNPVEGDILLTTTGTIGNVAIMPKAEEVSMDRGITLIKIDRQKVTSEFVAELLKQPSIQTEMGVNVHASAIGHLFMNRVKKLPAILPSMESQAEFTAFVRQVDKSKSVVKKSLDETQLLFDSLMQKYFG